MEVWADSSERACRRQGNRKQSLLDDSEDDSDPEGAQPQQLSAGMTADSVEVAPFEATFLPQVQDLTQVMLTQTQVMPTGDMSDAVFFEQCSNREEGGSKSSVRPRRRINGYKKTALGAAPATHQCPSPPPRPPISAGGWGVPNTISTSFESGAESIVNSDPSLHSLAPTSTNATNHIMEPESYVHEAKLSTLGAESEACLPSTATQMLPSAQQREEVYRDGIIFPELEGGLQETRPEAAMFPQDLVLGGGAGEGGVGEGGMDREFGGSCSIETLLESEDVSQWLQKYENSLQPIYDLCDIDVNTLCHSILSVDVPSSSSAEPPTAAASSSAATTGGMADTAQGCFTPTGFQNEESPAVNVANVVTVESETVEPPAATPPVKRKRGRPRKHFPPSDSAAAATSKGQVRKRGRPKADPEAPKSKPRELVNGNMYKQKSKFGRTIRPSWKAVAEWATHSLARNQRVKDRGEKGEEKEGEKSVEGVAGRRGVVVEAVSAGEKLSNEGRELDALWQYPVDDNTLPTLDELVKSPMADDTLPSQIGEATTGVDPIQESVTAAHTLPDEMWPTCMEDHPLPEAALVMEENRQDSTLAAPKQTSKTVVDMPTFVPDEPLPPPEVGVTACHSPDTPGGDSAKPDTLSEPAVSRGISERQEVTEKKGDASLTSFHEDAMATVPDKPSAEACSDGVVEGGGGKPCKKKGCSTKKSRSKTVILLKKKGPTGRSTPISPKQRISSKNGTISPNLRDAFPRTMKIHLQQVQPQDLCWSVAKKVPSQQLPPPSVLAATEEQALKSPLHAQLEPPQESHSSVLMDISSDSESKSLHFTKSPQDGGLLLEASGSRQQQSRSVTSPANETAMTTPGLKSPPIATTHPCGSSPPKTLTSRKRRVVRKVVKKASPASPKEGNGSEQEEVTAAETEVTEGKLSPSSVSLEEDEDCIDLHATDADMFAIDLDEEDPLARIFPQKNGPRKPNASNGQPPLTTPTTFQPPPNTTALQPTPNATPHPPITSRLGPVKQCGGAPFRARQPPMLPVPLIPGLTPPPPGGLLTKHGRLQAARLAAQERPATPLSTPLPLFNGIEACSPQPSVCSSG